MKNTSGKFLLEMLLGKELPLAFLFVEAGFLVLLIPTVVAGVLGSMGFDIFVSMMAGFIVGGPGIYFYAPIVGGRT